MYIIYLLVNHLALNLPLIFVSPPAAHTDQKFPMKLLLGTICSVTDVADVKEYLFISLFILFRVLFTVLVILRFVRIKFFTTTYLLLDPLNLVLLMTYYTLINHYHYYNEPLWWARSFFFSNKYFEILSYHLWGSFYYVTTIFSVLNFGGIYLLYMKISKLDKK